MKWWRSTAPHAKSWGSQPPPIHGATACSDSAHKGRGNAIYHPRERYLAGGIEASTAVPTFEAPGLRQVLGHALAGADRRHAKPLSNHRCLRSEDHQPWRIAERHRITRYDGIEDRLDNPPEPKVVIDNLDPSQQPGHFWKFLAMGPDGKLYFNIGAPGNIVMPNDQQASINRVDPKTGVMEHVARGVRNSVGFDWDPKTKQLWFTNHARDWLSDDTPNDTLHHVSRKGMHFGYPYCHQGELPDPEFGKDRSCAEFDPPAALLGAHIAPLGMRFYTGKMFPADYRNNIFVAMHGSWNRTTKQGYNVMRVTLGPKGKVWMTPFLEGFLTDPKADPPMWGRPVDVLVMRDGALLVSDDYNGIVYRITYKK